MTKESKSLIPASIILAGFVLALAVFFKGGHVSTTTLYKKENKIREKTETTADGLGIVADSFQLPVDWGDLGARLISAGVIDADKFSEIYGGKDNLTAEETNLLFGENNGKLKITKDNAGFVLNLFWALGLANKNPILDSGEMANPRYGGAQNFASTGGWTVADGNVTGHYSRHKFFNLSSEEQALVEKISAGIYRPCCDNSTHFPDCNHGMAMLGLLELMASQGVSEQNMWSVALAVNSYWFPDNYQIISIYMKNKGIKWESVNPQEILGINYSSASGYAKIASQVTLPNSSQGWGSCSVSVAEPSFVAKIKQNNC